MCYYLTLFLWDTVMTMSDFTSSTILQKNGASLRCPFIRVKRLGAELVSSAIFQITLRVALCQFRRASL